MSKGKKSITIKGGNSAPKMLIEKGHHSSHSTPRATGNNEYHPVFQSNSDGNLLVATKSDTNLSGSHPDHSPKKTKHHIAKISIPPRESITNHPESNINAEANENAKRVQKVVILTRKSTSSGSPQEASPKGSLHGSEGVKRAQNDLGTSSERNKDDQPDDKNDQITTLTNVSVVTSHHDIKNSEQISNNSGLNNSARKIPITVITKSDSIASNNREGSSNKAGNILKKFTNLAGYGSKAQEATKEVQTDKEIQDNNLADPKVYVYRSSSIKHLKGKTHHNTTKQDHKQPEDVFGDDLSFGDTSGFSDVFVSDPFFNSGINTIPSALSHCQNVVSGIVGQSANYIAPTGDM